MRSARLLFRLVAPLFSTLLRPVSRVARPRTATDKLLSIKWQKPCQLRFAELEAISPNNAASDSCAKRAHLPSNLGANRGEIWPKDDMRGSPRNFLDAFCKSSCVVENPFHFSTEARQFCFLISTREGDHFKFGESRLNLGKLAILLCISREISLIATQAS